MRFDNLLSPIRLDSPAKGESRDSTRFHPWLEAHANPELCDFNRALRATAVREGYRNALFPALTQSLFEVVSKEEEAAF
jgi:hypothetical protein